MQSAALLSRRPMLWGTLGAVVLCLSLGACTATEDTAVPCELSSTYPGFVPQCQAVLAQFGEESRLQVDSRLTAFLPPDVQPETPYGGLSGNPLTILLDEELADPRESTVTFGPGLATARIVALFDAGEVSGVVQPTVVDGGTED